MSNLPCKTSIYAPFCDLGILTDLLAPYRCCGCGEVCCPPLTIANFTELKRLICWFESSPLKPAELQVLRAQYEKEGDYVGIQTKFNYAWVWSPTPAVACCALCPGLYPENKLVLTFFPRLAETAL